MLEPSLRLVYFDPRGSGRSERPWTGAYSLPTLVEDIEALRRALGVPQIALVAHSLYGRSATNGSGPAHPGECSVTRALSGRELTASFRASMFPDTATATRLDSVYAASGLRNTG